jgi:hypothetical protein
MRHVFCHDPDLFARLDKSHPAKRMHDSLHLRQSPLRYRGGREELKKEISCTRSLKKAASSTK